MVKYIVQSAGALVLKTSVIRVYRRVGTGVAGR
jgi:hypothetical protein